MKNLLYILWICVHVCVAQEEVKAFRLDTYKYDNVISETDENGNIFLCFYYKNRFEIKVLDKNKNLTSGRAFKIKEFDKKFIPIGIGYDNSFVYVFFMDFRTNQITRLNYDRSNVMVPRLSPKMALPKNEKYIETVNVKGVFKILTLDGESNEFVVRSNKTVFDTLSSVRIHSGCETLLKVFLNGERDIYLRRIFNHNDNIQNTNFFSKIYFNKGLMRITIDQRKLNHLFEIDFNANTCQYSKLNFHLHRCNDGDIRSGNSHIKDERLFRVTYCSNILNFSIVDLDSMILSKNYNVTPDKVIDLKTGEIVSEVNYEDRSDTKEFLRSSEDYIDNLEEEGLAVAVSSLNDQEYLVQIGSSRMSLYTVTSPGYGPNFGMGGGVWMGGGGMGSPSIFGNPTLNNTYRKTTDIYFETIINQDNLAKSSNNYMENSLYDKIFSYENAKVNNTYKNISTIIENDSEILYGYFSGKDDLYHLIKF